ncbi:hypothetical protein ACIQRS_11985 [Streptomyces termitum]|uniref:Gram-positive cocci surface proteins LPxTG domain-containing protein n=1 Tax=Streptomyces termitum TaxID=67368 RepID=A0A918SU48_9ACTN|nr:hypothetical protein [Streptomyces termitum]GHA70535.1 hypothetical protein GCM10010305_11170 [Streptomyces termitum]
MAPAPRPLRGALAAATVVVLSAAPAATARPTAPTPAPAAPALLAPAAPAPPAPACGRASDDAFPLDVRFRDAPDALAAGGAPAVWELELRNTTGSLCAGVHPVLVLTDALRALRPGQIRLDFYDDGARRWRPVAFETTDEAENVGAFTDPNGPDAPGGPDRSADPDAPTRFDGFSVAAGRTLAVPVRLAFRADAAPQEVVLGAVLVQRRGADGDWIGRSDDHRLTIGPPGPEGPAPPTGPRPPSAPAPSTAPARPTAPAPSADPALPPVPPASSPPPAPTPPGAPVPVPDGSAAPEPSTGDGNGDGDEYAEGDPATRPGLPQLAATGGRDALLPALGAALLVLAGALLVRAARRRA